MRARQHFGCDVRVPCCRKARGTCGPCVLAQCTVKWLRSCGVYRCVLSMSSVSRRTSFYRTPVWASGRGSGGLRVRLALKDSARSPVLASRFTAWHPPPGMHSLLRSFSVSDRIQASPRHRGFRAALGSRKRETLPRPSMRIRMRGPRFAFAAGSWHVLAAARAGAGRRGY